MSGWDEGGVYYSDQTNSWDDVRGEAAAAATNHSIVQKFKEFIRNFETDNNVFPYRESLLHNPKFLLVDMEDLDAFDPDLPAKLRTSPADLLPLVHSSLSLSLFVHTTNFLDFHFHYVFPVLCSLRLRRRRFWWIWRPRWPVIPELWKMPPLGMFRFSSPPRRIPSQWDCLG